MKTLINRALYQFAVGIFFGMAVCNADQTGLLLLAIGCAIGLIFGK